MDDFSDLTSAVPKIEFPSGLKVRHPLFGIGTAILKQKPLEIV